MSFGSYSSDGSGKSKVSNLIAELGSFSSLSFAEENVFTLDISMDIVSLMNAFKAFHNLDDDFKSLV